MLIISLVLTASLLAVVNWIAYRSKKPSLPILGVCLMFLMGPPFLRIADSITSRHDGLGTAL